MNIYLIVVVVIVQVILCGMKLSMLPNFFDISPNLKKLVDVNLARNDLFNGVQVFGVSEIETFPLNHLYNPLH